jgi:AmmeMemoRadiSam system protein A
MAEVSPDGDLWRPRQACFVSIKRFGDLRGCIGTIRPVQENLGLEIMANAVSAAVRDPRFEPMRPEELAEVVFSVDVLGRPEEVADLSEFDPSVWGVVVVKGRRQGVLLPALEGVDTVERQLAIAAQKAGIDDLRDIRVQRFSVTRHREERP